MHKMHSKEFEEKLSNFELQLSKRFKKEFEVTTSIFRSVSRVVDENMNLIKPKTDFEWAVTFLFYRAYKLYWTILILSQKGFGPEAAILARSLMEHAVNMQWIAKDDHDNRAKLFLEYFHVARKKLYDNYDKYGVFPNLTDIEKQSMESREEIEKRYEEVKQNYPEEWYWAPIKIRTRAYDVGAEYDWDFYYWGFSFLAHPNASSQFDFLIPNQLENTFIIGPSYSKIQDVLVLGCKYLLLALNSWNFVFGLELENLIVELTHKLCAISRPQNRKQEKSGMQ
jgi:hypothetical protein